jgi:fatty acid-binding protein DegV
MEAYFDNSATTKALDSVRDIMVKTLTEDFGNPSAKHTKGMEAENYIRQAAADIAKTLKVKDKEILFTSGGTESNNMASIGTALLIREAVKLRDAGVNVADIAAACTEMSKYIKLTAVVGSLKYLKMGGRLSGAAAFAGTMLHITPVVSIEDGKVVVIGKTRGKKAAEKLMHDKLTEDGLSLTRDFMFGHINCSESLETFINKSLTYISDVNGNVGVSSIGCSVGTHVGPGTYGIAYVEAAESGMNRESIVKTA